MATQPPQPFFHDDAEDITGLRTNWFWFLILGVALVIIGLMAISFSFVATLAVVIVFGMLILAAGIVQIVSAFSLPKAKGMILHLLIGVLYTIVGLMLIDSPIAAAAGLTLLIAVFLMVGGVFRIAAALATRFRNWGLYLLNGVVSLMLGIIIWRHLLDEKEFLWVIGVFVGVEMLFCGASWIAFAFSVRSLPDSAESGGGAAA